MRQDAQAHSTEDKKRREEIDQKNQADNLVFQTRKQIKELGDKMPANLKEKVESTADALDAAVKAGNSAEIKSKTDELNTAWNEASAAMYQSASAGQPGAQQPGAPPPNEGQSAPPPPGEGGGKKVRRPGRLRSGLLFHRRSRQRCALLQLLHGGRRGAEEPDLRGRWLRATLYTRDHRSQRGSPRAAAGLRVTPRLLPGGSENRSLSALSQGDAGRPLVGGRQVMVFGSGRPRPPGD